MSSNDSQKSSPSRKPKHESVCGCFKCRLTEPDYCTICKAPIEWEDLTDEDIVGLCQDCHTEKKKVLKKIQLKKTALSKRLLKPNGQPPITRR